MEKLPSTKLVPDAVNGWGLLDLLVKMKVGVKSLSRVQLFATQWTVAYQPPPSMGFSRHEYWSGLPFPSPGDLPDPGIKPGSPTLEADALTSEPPGKPHLTHRPQLNFSSCPSAAFYNKGSNPVPYTAFIVTCL